LFFRKQFFYKQPDKLSGCFFVAFFRKEMEKMIIFVVLNFI